MVLPRTSPVIGKEVRVALFEDHDPSPIHFIWDILTVLGVYRTPITTKTNYPPKLSTMLPIPPIDYWESPRPFELISGKEPVEPPGIR